MYMISEEEAARRRAIVDQEIGSQRLEGLEPDPIAIEVGERWVAGKQIDFEAEIAAYIAKVKRS